MASKLPLFLGETRGFKRVARKTRNFSFRSNFVACRVHLKRAGSISRATASQMYGNLSKEKPCPELPVKRLGNLHVAANFVASTYRV